MIIILVLLNDKIFKWLIKLVFFYYVYVEIIYLLVNFLYSVIFGVIKYFFFKFLKKCVLVNLIFGK